MRAMKNASTAALVGIWMILLTAFVVTILYVGRQLLIPLALAAMLTFLLAPLVGYIERWIGRIAAVLIVVAMLFGVFGGAGWLLTRQLVDLAAKLPDYQTNIDNKLHAIRLPTGGAFGRFSHSVSELQKQLPDSLEPPANAAGTAPETKATTAARSRNLPAGQQPMPVRIVESQSRLPQILQNAATGLLGPLGTAAPRFIARHLHALKARGPARPDDPLGRARPDQRDHPSDGRRRQPRRSLPDHAASGEREFWLVHCNRTLLHRRAERRALGRVRGAPAICSLRGSVDRGRGSRASFVCSLDKLAQSDLDARPFHCA